MSSELERLLRESREALPVPDEHATERARRRSLDTLRPQRARRRPRVLALVAAMVVTAVLLGVTASSLNAPGVTAAREPATLGFVPQPGWFALQSPPPAVEGQQVVAVASNVPFAADDVDRGFVEPSGLPYSTLLALPTSGIVLVAAMTPDTPQHRAPVRVNPYYPDRELPLRFRDAAPFIQWGAQVRPDQPLANYQLRAQVGEHNVDVMFYFGTSRPSDAARAAAQRQLEGLVIGRMPTASSSLSSGVPQTTTTTALIDRTYACETQLLGGLYELRNRAHSGVRSGSVWSKLPYAAVATGGWAGPLTGLPNAPVNSLAWITAGTPSASTTAGSGPETFPVVGGGTVGVNRNLCRRTSAKVAFGRAGLRGGTAPRTALDVDCPAPRRLLVRLRATVEGASALRERARIFLATNAPASKAELVVRTPAGKLLSYASVDRSGRAQLFTAKGCARR